MGFKSTGKEMRKEKQAAKVAEIEWYKDKDPECGDRDSDYLSTQERDQSRFYKCVQRAIAFAKKEKRIALECPYVVKANYETSSGYIYFITFEATDRKSGTRKLYQTKVVYGSMEFYGKK